MKEGSEERGRSASDKEKTKLRERQRRAITTKIFSGLRKHGGYNLPSRADINDVLRELAREAGWVVEPDGTTYRAKKASSNKNVCSCYCQSKYNGSNAGGECPIGFNQQPSPCSSEVATVTSQLYFPSNSFCRNVAGDEDLSLSLYRDDVAAILANGSHFVGFHGSPSFQMIPHQHSFFFPETRSSNHNTPIASPQRHLS